MARSVWKLPYVDRVVFALQNDEEYLRLSSNEKRPFVIQLNSRASTISEELVNRKVALHNGRKFIRVALTEDHIGLKLGDLVLTKQIGVSIHLYNKINKKQKEKQKLLKQRKLNRYKGKKKLVKKTLKKKPKKNG